MLNPRLAMSVYPCRTIFYRNARYSDGAVDCKLVELCMFRGCESSFNSKVDGSGASDNFSFPYVFPRNRMINISYLQPKYVRVLRSSYTNNEHIATLHRKLTFSSFSDEEEIVMDACSLEEKAHMAVSYTLYNSSFYFYRPTIHKVRLHSHFLPLL